MHQKITPFRKFLVKLSDDLKQAPFVEKMHAYLQKEGYDVTHQDFCPLDIFQTMIQTCLISPNELSKLKEMMAFCARNDLMRTIDEFNNKRKGKVNFPSFLRQLYLPNLQLFINA